MPKAAIVIGSKSDAEVIKPAVAVLERFGVEVEVRVISAHRTPEAAHAFASNAEKNSIEVIIAAAGKAAHLGGVLAAYTVLPVIALPVKSSLMDGLDSLLSMVQMPSGIPVACVGVNAGENAGLLAVQMLQLKYPELSKKLQGYKAEMAEKVGADDAKIDEILGR